MFELISRCCVHGFCVLPFRVFFVKRAVNVIDASLLNHPRVEEFGEALEHWVEQEDESTEEDPLHGGGFGQGTDRRVQ